MGERSPLLLILDSFIAEFDRLLPLIDGGLQESLRKGI